MSKSKNCINCEAEDVNFAINISLCDACIGEKLEELQSENKILNDRLNTLADKGMQDMGFTRVENE